MSATTMGSTASMLEQLSIKKDELELLEVYRKAKSMGYADISITVQEGTRVKLWLTEKMR